MQPGILPEAAQQQKYALLKQAAEAGFPRAMNEVGVALMEGAGVAKDTGAALAWLKLAAARGVPDALYNQGLLHLDEAEVAVQYFERAAAAGSHQPFFNLGVAYLQGRGVDVNASAAAEWFELDGSSQGLHILSTIYRDTDTAAAERWRLKAAHAGSAAACWEVYAQQAADGTPDDDERTRWLYRAARFGDTRARDLIMAMRQRQRQEL